MTSAELSAATSGLENLDYADTKPAKSAGRPRATRAKGGSKTRKLPWDQVMRALAVSDPGLLLRADQAADAKGLKRSELISRALGAVIAAMKLAPRR